MKNNKKNFKWLSFSKNQLKVMTWWNEKSPVHSSDGIIADGAVRSGKTVSMSPSFVIWGMEQFDECDFAICGKTIGSLKRNVINTLKKQLLSLKYRYEHKRSENLLIVSKNNKTNYFYLFGGKDEASQDLIQGMTLAGIFFDEVALMPESFVEQGIARLSVEEAKFWFNCNPRNPNHWFKLNYVDKIKEKNILYLHFTMDDNLTLSEKVKERYKRMFTGVFYKRNILGLWVTAEGSIYNVFSENKEKYYTDKADYDVIQIGLDFGGNKSAHTLVATGIKNNYSKLTALMSDRYEATGMTPQQLYNKVDEFIDKVQQKYGQIYVIYCDSAEQTLINGIREMCDIKYPHIIIRNSIKNEIIDRIRCTTSLMASGRFFITRYCKTLEVAFENAVYNDKPKEQGKDERLDNGTSDIDTLDAFEYSFEKYIKQYSKIIA
ncbi:MAG: PBSX family phage terminase large subunit [Clostridia bacterium]